MGLMNITTILSAINVLLIISLLYIYGRSFFKIKSMFSAGLFVFALLFLVHNLVYLYFSFTMMPYYSGEIQTYGFIFTLLQTIAFAIINIISWR